jgi:hypothetical protein
MEEELHEFLTAAVDGREFRVSIYELQQMQHTVLGGPQRGLDVAWGRK